MIGRQSPEKRAQVRAERKASNMAALCVPTRALHRGVYAPAAEVPSAAPKTKTYRDATLLEMAHGRPCLLLVPGVCNHRLDSTVACHENEGKGMAIKAPDSRSVWGCYACHTFYDQGTAPRGYKRELFAQAMQMQVQAWQEIAADRSEPERFRNAARRALEKSK